MLGAIAGDVIGSVFEAFSTKRNDFPLFSPMSRFTDDTVLTIAVTHSILEGTEYSAAFREFGLRYPYSGYGATFFEWLHAAEPAPYGSWGNGSAMRVSPVGFAFDTVEKVLEEAAETAAPTHNHPEGIKGAQAVALAVFLARSGASKRRIRDSISGRFGYDLNRSLDQIRPVYKFEISCQKSVPESLIAFLESEDFEDAIRKAISLGGDADTMACIAGGIAEAFYGEVPVHIVEGTRKLVPDDLLEVVDRFYASYK
jgi:ADP-ribosylglycohydrolase